MQELERRTILRRYVDMSLKLADAFELMEKDEADTICRKHLSCGCRVVPDVLRKGVASLVTLMTDYQYICDMQDIEADDAKRARDFLKEIFGYEFVDELDVGITEALKAKLKPLNLHEEVNRLCEEYNDGK